MLSRVKNVLTFPGYVEWPLKRDDGTIVVSESQHNGDKMRSQINCYFSLQARMSVPIA